VGAFVGEALGDALANAAAGAGDQDALLFKPLYHKGGILI